MRLLLALTTSCLLPALGSASAAASGGRVVATVTGHVVGPNGVGVPGIDIDLDNLGSGGRPDVFNDGTDANGNFTMTVDPQGVYEVLFFPPPPPTTTLMPL